MIVELEESDGLALIKPIQKAAITMLSPLPMVHHSKGTESLTETWGHILGAIKVIEEPEDQLLSVILLIKHG
ncbi:hypothetical protein OPV22_022575 [Ensete ventricosum]|uniref:Uncharacterized protein n=1 Tax=Ensete ventricosum TaxID=4639 RepID=A0AAV8QNS8_ENSVE|nr:hypothetical protein OPV22_022575 [Ensete ventricosum]